MLLPAAVFWQFTMLPATMMPPARYDHPFKGKVVVHEMAACKGCGGWTHGARGGVCEVYVVKTGNWIEQIVIRHEIAHCNGWPANHPR